MLGLSDEEDLNAKGRYRSLHYKKIVQNEHFVRTIQQLPSRNANSAQGYPQEWFPSVSATIGDRYPERSFFQVFIAITSGTLRIYIPHEQDTYIMQVRGSLW